MQEPVCTTSNSCTIEFNWDQCYSKGFEQDIHSGESLNRKSEYQQVSLNDRHMSCVYCS